MALKKNLNINYQPRGQQVKFATVKIDTWAVRLSAVRAAKLGPLKEPIRNRTFITDKFTNIVNSCSTKNSPRNDLRQFHFLPVDRCLLSRKSPLSFNR